MSTIIKIGPFEDMESAVKGKNDILEMYSGYNVSDVPFMEDGQIYYHIIIN